MIDPALATLRGSKAHVLVDDLERPLLSEDTEHHLRRVLRLANGDELTATDGRGSWRTVSLTTVGIKPIGPLEFRARRTRSVTIGVAIPKQDRPEWIVQKLTELGVARIVMLHADRSVVRWSADRAAKKLDRLRATAVEALQQSRGVWLPDVTGPVEASSMLAIAAIAEPDAGPFPETTEVYLVGPEGGWSAAERDAASTAFGLGDTILRVETAAIAVAFQALNVI